MKRGIAVALLGLFAFASGCASPARNVEKKADSGIIAIPSNTNDWPGYNRREALALIQKHVGPYYKIDDEREVVTGQSTVNNQQTNTEAVPNRRNPNLPGERQTTTATTTQRDVTEFRIWYHRVAAPEGPPINEQPYGGVPGGVNAAGGPPPGTIPSVQPGGTQPGVQQIGGQGPRWISGAGTHTMPSVRPAAGGANCDY